MNQVHVSIAPKGSTRKLVVFSFCKQMGEVECIFFPKLQTFQFSKAFPPKKRRPLAHGLWQGKSFALLYVSYGHAHGDSFYYEDS